MKQKLPTNANTARIPLLLGNYSWEMLVEETARSRQCGLHNSYPLILVGKNLVPKYTAHTKSHAIFSSFFSTCNISKKMFKKMLYKQGKLPQELKTSYYDTPQKSCNMKIQLVIFTEKN
jgi:hypothetical protein